MGDENFFLTRGGIGGLLGNKIPQKTFFHILGIVIETLLNMFGDPYIYRL